MNFERSEKILDNIKGLALNSDKLIIWTDYDREGELIGKQVAEMCISVNKNI